MSLRERDIVLRTVDKTVVARLHFLGTKAEQ
jgi:hypothetical protein